MNYNFNQQHQYDVGKKNPSNYTQTDTKPIIHTDVNIQPINYTQTDTKPIIQPIHIKLPIIIIKLILYLILQNLKIHINLQIIILKLILYLILQNIQIHIKLH